MAFRLGDIIEKTDAGPLRGIQREIACDCWFTSRGRSFPRIIKVMDEQGIIHTISDIEILFSEEKMYSGIATVEHLCRINFGASKETVKLIYNKETCKWHICILP